MELVQRSLAGICTPIFRQKNLPTSNFQTVICLTLISYPYVDEDEEIFDFDKIVEAVG
jgi:hypothetical protein